MPTIVLCESVNNDCKRKKECKDKGKVVIKQEFSDKTKSKSDHELLITKFRLILRKVGKTARPFRYDLNQIPYEYTVEVRNRFKGLDLIDRVPDELWNEFVTLYRRQGSRPSPWKRNAKSKMAVWGGLTNSCEKKRSEKQRRKGKL